MQRLLLAPLALLLAAAALLMLTAEAFVVAPGAKLPTTRGAARHARSKGVALALFDFFGGGNKKKEAAAAASAPAAAADDKKKGMTPLERRAVKIPDSGAKLPQLYNGWFDGSIVNDMSAAVKAALKDGVQRAEIICPPIPNVEELDFGTALNQQYNQQLAARLKANEKQSRKNLLAFANVDWANRVAQKLGKRALLAAFDGTVPASGVTLCKNAELTGINSEAVASAGANDVIFALSPGTQSMWSKAGSIKAPAPVIGLNAPFSLSYDIGYNPSKFEQIYVVRRCTKGWIFRAYPGPYKAYLETPDGKCELIKVYEKGEVPKLNQVSKLIREESQARGYGIATDRYLTARL